MFARQEIKNLRAMVLGSFSERLGAYLIDILLIKAVTSIILSSYELVGIASNWGSFSLIHLTRSFIYFAYFILMTKYNKGQTIGKMIFSLRVLSIDHVNISWEDVFYRELIGRYIQKKIKIFYLLLFLTKQNQTMADLVTDTVVVSEKRYLDLEEYLVLEKK